MAESTHHKLIEAIATSIEVPDSAYQTAEARYNDIAKWFCRPESECSGFAPHVSPQGSFLLGTVIRPLDDRAEYDLDLACILEEGISKQDSTQENLKALVGLDVESYRVARNIRDPREEMHRCWRLNYADQLSFHMDIVPCIPEAAGSKKLIEAAMLKAGTDRSIAQQVANLTVSITDDRHRDYRRITADWSVSNPQGYGQWFKSRMRQATKLLEKRMLEARVATIDDLPTYRWKTPLQRSVQLLKRHRDIMFRRNPEVQPISIIITTLAALAYQGETDLGDAMERILAEMGQFVRKSLPRVPNPVNPQEDFADKWATLEGRSKRLEENFDAWLAQAQADFRVIEGATDPDFITNQVLQKLGARLSSSDLRARLALPGPMVAFSPKSHDIREAPPRPWAR